MHIFPECISGLVCWIGISETKALHNPSRSHLSDCPGQMLCTSSSRTMTQKLLYATYTAYVLPLPQSSPTCTERGTVHRWRNTVLKRRYYPRGPSGNGNVCHCHPTSHPSTPNLNSKQAWFANDATTGGRLHQLQDWWTKLNTLGPSFGCFLNPSKSWLIIKPEYLHKAQELFANTNVNIISEGKRHLGALLGSGPFVSKYMWDKVNEWINEI